jgi:multidrug efflux pump
MLAASVLAIFLIPVSFYVVERLAGDRHSAMGPAAVPEQPLAPVPTPGPTA